MLKITIPVSLRDIAGRISRALDSDTGGAQVFDFCDDSTRDEDGEIVTPARLAWTIIQSSDPYAERLTRFRHARDLHDFVVADYATRWPELQAPTLAECETFLAAATIEDVETSADA